MPHFSRVFCVRSGDFDSVSGAGHFDSIELVPPQLRLSTERATPRINRNFAQALRAFLCRRISRRRFFPHPRDQPIHRYHHKEIHSTGDQDERDNGIHEIANRKRGRANGELESSIIRLAHNERDQRSQKSFSSVFYSLPRRPPQSPPRRHVANAFPRRMIPNPSNVKWCLQIRSARECYSGSRPKVKAMSALAAGRAQDLPK